jgi:carboxyl-terminal processing protease
VVLDLRFNPGGLIDSAMDITKRFIDGGLIMTARGRHGRPIRYRGKSTGSRLTVPIACLANGDSSMMSEVVAACLQDHKRAVIVGERTSGKAYFQSIFRLKNGTRLRFTTTLFYRITGKNLTKWMTPGRENDVWGVSPDKGFALKLPSRERKLLARHLHRLELISRFSRSTKPAFRDRQFRLAVDYLRRKVRRAERN